ncbi:MAG: asparagine synthase (glutamine-hydrolyzing) [Polyangiaceae bacterium]|jgi:asparagine synthase (glutamine-hydrolysing)
MCAITGILAAGGVNVRAVQAMTDRLGHRGPDGEGLWRSEDGTCVLGHRRLAIVDLSDAGRQPMELAEFGLTVTFNGEIYNYLELRERLQARGHAFRSQSDTEVLLHAYAEWGERCLDELNGMFAFALWDANKRQLLCARDRFGEKPFMYAWIDRAFVFASEAKSLGLLRGLDTSIDDGMLALYAERDSTWIDSSERTLVRGVKQLLPAQAMRIRVDGTRVEVAKVWTYWAVDCLARRPYGSDDPRRASEELRELLRDSVRLRLRSDVPVGSCLSGGLDSSTVVSLMRRLEPNADLRTFTGRFPGDPLDEGRYARLVVEQNRTIAREVEPTPERFEREAARLYWHADFPIGGMSQFAQWCVFHLASEHGVTVLLDGQGSDEQLGGYGSGTVSAFLDQLLAEGRWRAWLHERAAAAKSAPALFSWPRLALHRTPARLLLSTLRRAGGRSRMTRQGLFRSDWLDEARKQVPEPDVSPALDGPNAFSRTLWLLSFRTMLSALLRFGDRLSMAHSREVRLPFCDHRIAEFCFALSPDLLVGEGQAKRVLRLAGRGLVPDAIAARAKQGFVPPQTAWLVGPLATWTSGLADSSAGLMPAVRPEAVVELAQASRADRTREIGALWDASNLLAWARFALEPLRQSAAFEARADLPP